MHEPTELHPIYKALTPYVVALFGIRQEGPTTYVVLHRGSGTLITINGVFGILTAGHVIEALKPFEFWAYASFNGLGGYTPLHQFYPEEDPICLGEDYKNTDGPDIGFIRVPEHISSMPSAEATFYNITHRYKEARNRKRSDVSDLPIRVIAGVIGDSSETIKISHNSIDIQTTMLIAPAQIILRSEFNDMDYYTLRIGETAGMTRVDSYNGVSGGPVFATKENATSALDRILVGVAFKQSDQDENGNRTILCHGFNSIYQCLCPIITMKYSDQPTLEKFLARSSNEDSDSSDQ